MAKLTLTGIDWDQAGGGRGDLIESIAAQLPVTGSLRAVLPGPDRPDYFVCSVDRPIVYRPEIESSAESAADHVILAALFVGDTLHRGMSGLPVRVALVTDNTVLTDERLDFVKCIYVGQGFVNDAGTE